MLHNENNNKTPTPVQVYTRKVEFYKNLFKKFRKTLKNSEQKLSLSILIFS